MVNNLSHDTKGTLLIFLSAFMYATLPVFAKLSYAAGLTPSQALGLRYLSALLILFSYLKLWKRTQVFSFSPLVIIQGLVIITSSLFYFSALQYLPAGLATVIFFTYPAIVALVAIPIYKERFVLKLFIGISFALIGITLISGLGHGNIVLSPRGLILATIASFCYAIHSLIGQRNINRASSLSLTATFSLVAVIIISIITNRDLSFMAHLTTEQALIGLGMGLLNTVLSGSLFLKGISYIGASRASVISTLEPVLTLIIAFLILGEMLTLKEMIGSLFVFASIFLASNPSHSSTLEKVKSGF